MSIALITGITGQDGSYLAELLLEKGYKVHGILRRSSSFNTERIQHLYQDPHVTEQRLFLHYADMTDAVSLLRVVNHVQPDEIYNLAAQSHVGVSFKVPDYTTHVDAIGTLHILESIRETRHAVRFYQASSSELYGKVMEVPQTEETPFYPRSPYACAKAYAFYITRNYREAYGFFASNGILFNHESPRRNPTFVTRKITRGIARIVLGLEECVYLGNLEARRDWGYAKDYVEGMWRILQHDRPDDFVLATGEMHSVREFIEEVCAYFEIALAWQGQGLDECGINTQTGRKIIQIDPQYFRPSEVDLLIGDASKARRELSWNTRVSFQELVRLMCKADFENEARLCP